MVGQNGVGGKEVVRDERKKIILDKKFKKCTELVKKKQDKSFKKMLLARLIDDMAQMDGDELLKAKNTQQKYLKLMQKSRKIEDLSSV